MTRLLITGGKLVNEGTLSEKDLLIKSGRIERIEDSISPPSGTEILNAEGKRPTGPDRRPGPFS